MDLRQLRYFLTVAECGHIGRAALRLHISQPPLTRQIQQMEQDLGVRLFNRTARGVEPTAAGELLAEEARNLLGLLEQATERVRRTGQGRMGRLDVAIFGSAILDFIPRLVLAFRQEHPEVRVLLHNLGKDAQYEALRQRRIDVGFNRLVETATDLQVERVLSERLMVALPGDHVLAVQPQVPLAVLAGEPLVLYPTGPRPSFIDTLWQLCGDEGFQPWVVQEVGDALTAIALAAAGLGICIVPESATRLQLPGVVYRPLMRDPLPTVDLSCIWRAGDDAPLLNAFLETTRRLAREAQATTEALRTNR